MRWPEPDSSAFAPLGLEVSPSGIAGKGLFTTRPRREGERIVAIAGEIISGDQAEIRDADGNVYIYEVDEDTYVDAAAGPGRYVNHSCRPTCRIDGAGDDGDLLVLVAARDLAAGDELTIDYDYDEIFAACARHNPRCLGAACPRAKDAAASGS